MRRPTTHGITGNGNARDHEVLKERMKELQCLYQVARLDEGRSGKAQLQQQACTLLKEGFRFPERTEVSITFNGRTCRTAETAKQRWQLTSMSEMTDGQALSIEVTVADDGTGTDPFLLPEEQEMLDTVAGLLGTKLHHRNAVKENAKGHRTLRNILANSADVICTIDPKGVFHTVSAASEKVWGYTPKEMEGRNFTEFVHPDDHGITVGIVQRIMAGTEVTDFNNRYEHRNGTMVHMAWSARWDGKDGLIYCVARDVTDTVELQRMLDTATDLARVGAWEIDTLTDRLHWSPMTKRIHEVPEDFEPDLATAVNFYREDVREKVMLVIGETMAGGEPFDFVQPIITAKGNERWVRAIGNAEFLDGRCIRVFGSFQDIHDSKMAEEEIHRQHRFLTVVHEVVNLFMRHDDWQEVIETVLKKTGRAVDADRAYYFEGFTHETSGETHYCQRHEWNSGTAPAQMDNEQLLDIDPALFPQFFGPLLRGEHIISHTSEQEDDLKEVLESQQIYTTLSIPVTLHGRLYGFIGFDDCRTERTWTYGEMPLLQSVASNLATAIGQKLNADLIRESYEEKNDILESISDGFFTVNRQWTVTYWNREAERMLAINRDLIVGRNLWEVFSDAKGMAFYRQYHLAMEQGRSVQFEEYYPVRDMWYDVTAYPSRKGLSVFFRDITGKKRAQEQLRLSNERFERVTEATNDAIWDWDMTKDTLLWGVGFERLFGFSAKETRISIPDWTSRIHVEDLARVMGSLHDALDNPYTDRWEQEYRFKRADGSYASIVDRGIIIRDNDGLAIRMVGAKADITVLKQQQEKLRQANMELQRSNSDLEQFAYVASHDLQEPLRMVTSFLDQLRRKYEGQLDDRAQQYIHFAHSGALRMRQTILDLLQFSRAGRVGQKLESVDTSSLVVETLQLLRDQVEATGTMVKFKDLPTVMAARTPLQQVFQNLIANAIIYRRPGVKPLITITASYHGRMTKFSVSDNGMGIDPRYFDKIFLMFQRLHGRDEIPGSGIGLAVCKKVVEGHGGEIWVESTEGKGSTFHFTLKTGR